jgi:hypothetical protein
MKRIIIPIVALLACGASSMAQSEGDLLLMSRNQLNGTARSISLGGAMGAVGGDMSAIAINPAGIGVYRSSEFSFSQGINYNTAHTQYNGTQMNDERFNSPLNQIGYVGTWRPMREATSGVVSTHFGVGYNRINGFDQNFVLGGYNIASSMLSNFVIDANGLTPSELGSFGSGLAYDAYLLDLLPGMENEYYHSHEMIDNNNQVVMPNTVNQRQMIDKNGYGGEYNFTFGMNISHILQLGASLNFQSLLYDETNAYREFNNYDVIGVGLLDVDNFEYYRYTSLRGTSFNAKIGAIVRPINELRLGLAFHTPNYYEVTQEYNERMVSTFKDGESYTNVSPFSEIDFKFRSPSKLVASLAYVSNRGLLSVDYEYMDYTKAKFSPSADNFDMDNTIDPLNTSIETFFKPVHNIRAGAEFKINDVWMARLGAGIYGSPYKSEYVTHDMTRYTYTTGFGYRNNYFFVDVAYQMSTQKEDYYPYNYNTTVYNYLEPVQPATFTNTNHQLSATVGWKF